MTLVAPLLDELELFGVEQLLDFRLRLALGGPLLEPLGHLVCISKAGNSTIATYVFTNGLGSLMPAGSLSDIVSRSLSGDSVVEGYCCITFLY